MSGSFIIRRTLGCLFVSLLVGCTPAKERGTTWEPLSGVTNGGGEWSVLARDPTVTRRIGRSYDRNGRLVTEDVSIRRDGVEVCSWATIPSRKSVVRVYWSYYGPRHVAVAEADEDGDGFYEHLTLYDEQMNVVGAFERGRDGTVVPFSKAQESEIMESGRRIRGVSHDPAK